MEDSPGSGIFLRITGDIDFIGMFRPDGSLPGLLARIAVYKALRKAGLLEHGESFTFYLKDLRVKFLQCCSPKAMGGAGQKMLAPTPSGQVLTTQFVDNLSVVEGGLNNALAVGKDQFAFLAGTLTERFSPSRVITDVTQAINREVVPLVQVSVLARLVLELDAAIDRAQGVPVRVGPDGGPQVYETPATESGPERQGARDARAGNAHRTELQSSIGQPDRRIQLAAVGNDIGAELAATLVQLVADGYQPEPPPVGAQGGQWRPVTADQIRTDPPGSGFKVAPYTYITEDMPRGSTVIPVLGLRDLGVTGLSPFFAVGDRVVIDPGGSREEFATLASVHPFTLNRPLQNNQEIGTTVLFLSGIDDMSALPGALPALENLLVWLRADAGLTLTNGTNVVSWTDQSRNNFVFSAPSATTRPAWMPNASGRPPAVRFSGSANPHIIGNLGRTLTNATIFTLARYLDAGGGTRYIYSFGTRNSSGLQMTLGRQSSDGAFHFDGAASRLADKTIPGTNFFVFSQVFGEGSPDQHRLMVNAKTVLATRTTVGRAYSAIATNLYIGRYPGLGGFGGELVEWLVYDRVLSVEERFEVEEYLRQRAGLGPFVPAGSFDLSSWDALAYDTGVSSNAVWNLDLNNRMVSLTNATDPAMLLSPLSFSNQVFRAQLGSDGTNGFLGFVFGFENVGKFLLFDWNRATTIHPTLGLAPAGMRLRAFHVPGGNEPTAADFWASANPAHVSLLATNATPWTPGKTYDLTLNLLANRTEFMVADGTNTLATWTLPEIAGVSGQAGFYANQAAGARFGDFSLPGSDPLLIDISVQDEYVEITWINGQPPFVIEGTSDLANGEWHELSAATPNYSDRIPVTETALFLRVRSKGPTPSVE